MEYTGANLFVQNIVEVVKEHKLLASIVWIIIMGFILRRLAKKDNDYYLNESFFKKSKKNQKKKSKVFLEFRTIKDPMAKIGKKISYNERISDHYRRFIIVEELKKLSKLNNFKIIYQKKSFNFARFKNQKPHICRMILVKN